MNQRFKVILSEEAERDIDEYIQFIIDVYKAPATAENIMLKFSIC